MPAPVVTPTKSEMPPSAETPRDISALAPAASAPPLAPEPPPAAPVRPVVTPVPVAAVVAEPHLPDDPGPGTAIEEAPAAARRSPPFGV